jgi:HK97 family phage portal protein
VFFYCKFLRRDKNLKIPLLSRIFNPRASPKNSFWSPYKFFFGGTSSGKYVNEKTAMQTSAVYACVRVLAETIASLPFHTYRRTDNGKEKAIDHDLYYILHDEPNLEMTSFSFREVMMTHLLLWGNAYAQIIRDGRNKILGLYPLLPDKMRVDRNDNGEIYYIYNKDGVLYQLRRDEVLHIPGLGFDGIIGHSPIAMAKNAVGMALATEEFGSKLFSNDARPSVVLQHPGVVKDPKRLRESWNSVYQGSGNAHKTAILEEGMSIQTLSIPPNDAQFLETRKFQIEEICRIFRVAPHLVASLDRATFSNIEHQGISFVVHTIRPWLVRIEQAMNKALFVGSEKREYFVSLVVDGLLRGDFSSRLQGYSTGIQNGIYSINDVRNLENMDLVSDEEGGNFHMINGNMLKLSDVGAYANKNNTGLEVKNE